MYLQCDNLNVWTQTATGSRLHFKSSIFSSHISRERERPREYGLKTELYFTVKVDPFPSVVWVYLEEGQELADSRLFVVSSGPLLMGYSTTPLSSLSQFTGSRNYLTANHLMYIICLIVCLTLQVSVTKSHTQPNIAGRCAGWDSRVRGPQSLSTETLCFSLERVLETEVKKTQMMSFCKYVMFL